MNKGESIIISEKPDWVSWDDIHEVLLKSHEQNRDRGINMAFPTLPGEKIREKIEGHGKMFVATVGDIVVGTGAVIRKKGYLWCGKDDYAYLCLASVLPAYNGQGIYRLLRDYRESEAHRMGVDKVLFETHEGNDKVLSINSKNGYKCVDLKVTSTDHYNVLMVKWLAGCPYPDWYVKCQFLVRRWYKKLRFKPGHVKRFGI